MTNQQFQKALVECVQAMPKNSTAHQYEQALGRVIENYYPDRPYFETTKCRIAESVYSKGTNNIVGDIVRGMKKSNVLNESKHRKCNFKHLNESKATWTLGTRFSTNDRLDCGDFFEDGCPFTPDNEDYVIADDDNGQVWVGYYEQYPSKTDNIIHNPNDNLGVVIGVWKIPQEVSYEDLDMYLENGDISYIDNLGESISNRKRNLKYDRTVDRYYDKNESYRPRRLRESDDLSYDRPNKVYYNKNQSGYSTMGMIVDDENKQYQYINGQQMRPGKYKKSSKRGMYDMGNTLKNKGYSRVRNPQNDIAYEESYRPGRLRKFR